jgi:hypothetical protein
MDSTSQDINNRVSGIEVSSFTVFLCSRLKISRKAAIRVLLFLEADGHIHIVWKSPHGPRFYLRNSRKRITRINFGEGVTGCSLPKGECQDGKDVN